MANACQPWAGVYIPLRVPVPGARHMPLAADLVQIWPQDHPWLGGCGWHGDLSYTSCEHVNSYRIASAHVGLRRVLVLTGAHTSLHHGRYIEIGVIQACCRLHLGPSACH